MGSHGEYIGTLAIKVTGRKHASNWKPGNIDILELFHIPSGYLT